MWWLYDFVSRTKFWLRFSSSYSHFVSQIMVVCSSWNISSLIRLDYDSLTLKIELGRYLKMNFQMKKRDPHFVKKNDIFNLICEIIFTNKLKKSSSTLHMLVLGSGTILHKTKPRDFKNFINKLWLANLSGIFCRPVSDNIVGFFLYIYKRFKL